MCLCTVISQTAYLIAPTSVIISKNYVSFTSRTTEAGASFGGISCVWGDECSHGSCIKAQPKKPFYASNVLYFCTDGLGPTSARSLPLHFKSKCNPVG